MDKIEKGISLFKYIKELYAQKYDVTKDVRKHQWFKFINEIPSDEENIIFNYLDRTDEVNEEETENTVILQVRKPEFEQCPSLPDSLNKWVNGNWDNFKSTVTPTSKLIQYKNGEEVIISFEDDIDRVKQFKEWNKKRDKWVKRQKKIEITRDFFNELYFLYLDLERESEMIEFMIGQGVLSCEINSNVNVYHPILLKRLALSFDAQENVITISDTNTNPEIYTMLLQEIDYINHSCVKGLKDELADNFYHPLDRNDTPDFLKSFAHLLYSDSRYEENSNSTTNLFDKLVIYNNPVFFVRKRTGGILKALEEIIDQISETRVLSGPLLNLIGENEPQLIERTEEIDLSESLAEISGEDKEILLSKEANKEQLEIAKRIENYNAVLVQGPPGTGKTHTIANLMGHFLAQGKNILVTSYTKKALSVVKEKVVPELQNLCVAVLGDNNKDMERSIDGITEYISSHTSLELSENIAKLKEKREHILEDLSRIRKNIFAIKNKEYETIIFGGKGYSVAEAARFVHDNEEELSYLPGEVLLNKPLPVSLSDLELVYQTNSKISILEESELNSNLPNPKELLSPKEFQDLIKNKNENIELLKSLKLKLNEMITVDMHNFLVYIDGEPLCENYNSGKAEEIKMILGRNKNKQYLEWEFNAILAGKKGGGFKKVWDNLVDIIEETSKFAGEITPLTIGKNLTTSDENILDGAITILNEIKDYLESGKKLNGFTFLLHKEWKNILHEVKINNNQMETAKDIEIAISLIKLKLKRKELESLWIELIQKHGGIAFGEFGEEPEQSCISYIPQIKECLSWYLKSFNEIKSMLIGCGFNPSCIEGTTQFTYPIQEVEYLTNLVYKVVPKYIQLAEITYVNLPQVLEKINNNYEKISRVNSESAVCGNILFAIKNEDINEYRNHFSILENLYTKYFYQSERKRIINDIAKYAPDWAKLIENRVGIHGESIVPNNIEEAWKWKQFSGIINEITSQPFDELQHKLVCLNTELRKATAELAENSSWYHLITRIEADISQKQALQGWKLTTKKIGKGTGKTAPKLKKEAQKLMAKCQSAVPAWIMPINKALESLDPTKNKFDIIIIDEASQADISSLAIMYLAQKIIIVGDDEQVSPSGVGLDVDKMENLSDMYIKGAIPNSHLYDMKSSLYDIAKTTFPTLMLKEHFRCVPNIIGYSNRLSYDYKIKPLRDDSDVPIKPATISYHVDGKREGRKRNTIEAENIVALMLACMKQPEYEGMTFGVISLLGDEQANLINKIINDKLSPQEYEERKILCGNASHFQGDERDVIFISLVDSNEGEGPLRISGEGVGKQTKQRYNVAVSRAKNQLWVVHSLDVNNDLKTGDMRKELIEYALNPLDFAQQESEIQSKADSPFEVSVANFLVKNGYHIVQQWTVGSYRIDMVAIYGDRKIAIECDGELYHSGYDKVRDDMERQTILERLGWKFIRIRGSEFYRNQDETMRRVLYELSDYGIQPEKNIEINAVKDTELKQRVITTAEQILYSWKLEDTEEIVF